MKEEEKVDIRSKFTEQLFEVEGNIVAGIQILATDGSCSSAGIIGSPMNLLNALVGALKDKGPLRGLLMHALMMSSMLPNRNDSDDED